MTPWFVYVVRCNDDTLYIGISPDVATRLEAHESGKGAKYTRGRGPLELLTQCRCASQGDALRLERALKQLERKQKLALTTSRTLLSRFARAVREEKTTTKRRFVEP